LTFQGGNAACQGMAARIPEVLDANEQATIAKLMVHFYNYNSRKTFTLKALLILCEHHPKIFFKLQHYVVAEKFVISFIRLAT